MVLDIDSTRDVVTAFLVDTANRILLLKRSSSVRTYRGLWGAVSGYLEVTDPLLQSEIEIREETGFSRNVIEMSCRGNPLLVSDNENNWLWRIHPFRFRYSGSSETIELSEEHVEYRWGAPSTMKRLSTVPDLVRTWNRVKS